MKYIATYNPQRKGRLGMKLYERLVENAEKKWNFSSHHSAQSWRERYKNNQQWFDAQILKYQKKHEISPEASEDLSSHAAGAGKSLSADSRPRTDIKRGSTTPVIESGAKKRLREVDPEDKDLHSDVKKKMRRDRVSTQGSRQYDSPQHTILPSVQFQNGEEARAEVALLPLPGKDEAAPSIGPDDYAGASSGPGKNEQEVKSEGRRISPSAGSSRPSSPANDGEVKPFFVPRTSSNPSLVGATAAPEELSLSHRQDHPSRAVSSEASEFVRKSVPLQLSQEPTPPHTSAVNSPRSPLPLQPPTNGHSSQSKIIPQHMLSASLTYRRVPSAARKRRIIPEEDDIFSTPPPQAVQESASSRARGREAPRLVEGHFRSAYTNTNGAPRLMLRDQLASGIDKESETDNDDEEEWPPRRGKRKSPKFSEGPIEEDSIPSQERAQFRKELQQGQMSRAPSAPGALSVAESKPTTRPMSTIEPASTDKNPQRVAPLIGQTHAVPLQVAQVLAPAATKTSRIERGALQRDVTALPSRDPLPSNSKRHLSSHGSIQSKGRASASSRSRLFFPAASGHKLPSPAPGPPSKRASLGQYSNPALRDDPFTVPSINRDARRRTLAGDKEIPRVDARRKELIRRASVQHIDLRELQSIKSMETSSAMSFNCSNSSSNSGSVVNKWPHRPSRSSTPPNLSDRTRNWFWRWVWRRCIRAWPRIINSHRCRP
ncbi:hypothetical protein BC826DRAFT_384932 [Russula brevipes]|nr:hypothetical protein BC826DRAFT_384932 [Russula brevipes]